MEEGNDVLLDESSTCFTGPTTEETPTDDVDEPNSGEKKKSSSWSGSGIWERTENRRWETVENHMIPAWDNTAADTSLVSGLGIGHYLQNFEEEVEGSVTTENSFRIITSGSTMMRISNSLDTGQPCSSETEGSGLQVLETIIEEELSGVEAEPVAGPSGLSQIMNQQCHSSDSTSKPSEPKKPAVKSESFKRMLRRKRSRRKRRKQRLRGGGGGARTRKALKVRTPSEASSPGRSTPSPDSLTRICLYWEKQLTSPDYYIPPSDSEESE